MSNSIRLLYLFLLAISPHFTYAQCTAGAVTKAHASAIFDIMLDPDGDGYITETGSAFTSGTTEMSEFEVIPNSTTGWIEIQDVSETDSDITPTCGNSDLIQDDNGGDFAYYNIVDPTPGAPSGGDEYIIFRFRLAKSPNGNFGYNFLVDNDAAYGSGTDVNSICGNMGFEREVQFANAGGKKGVSVYDVDGSIVHNSTLCNQCISLNDVQEACAASSGGCATSDPQFVTFPLPLSHIGVPSNVSTMDLYIAVATASSGNATSVLGGGNVTDFGALDGTNTGCSCTGLSGCALFDCQTDCINSYFAALPVELLYFQADQVNDDIKLNWATATEINNSHFNVEHSTDGLSFKSLGEIQGANNSFNQNTYSYTHYNPDSPVNYYRLKQIDFDDSYSYSQVEVVTIKGKSKSTFSVSPTLAQNFLQLNLYHSGQKEIEVNIIDFMGRTFQSLTIDKEIHSIQIPVHQLPIGHYFIQVQFIDTISTQRFVKASN